LLSVKINCQDVLTSSVIHDGEMKMKFKTETWSPIENKKCKWMTQRCWLKNKCWSTKKSPYPIS